MDGSIGRHEHNQTTAATTNLSRRRQVVCVFVTTTATHLDVLELARDGARLAGRALVRVRCDDGLELGLRCGRDRVDALPRPRALGLGAHAPHLALARSRARGRAEEVEQLRLGSRLTRGDATAVPRLVTLSDGQDVSTHAYGVQHTTVIVTRSARALGRDVATVIVSGQDASHS